MPFRQTYVNQLNDPVLAANTIASFTGPQNLIKTTGNAAYVAQPCIIPVNYLKAGTTIRTKASGTFANSSTTPTMAWGVYYGSTALAVCTAVTETSGATIQMPWFLETITVIRSTVVPSAVVTITHGWLTYSTTLNATCVTIPIPGTAAATVNVDNTVSGEWSVQATCGTSAAGNTVTLHDWTFEEITQI